MKTSYRDVLISKTIQRHTLRSNQYREKPLTNNVKKVLIQTYNDMKVPNIIQQRVIKELGSNANNNSSYANLGVDTSPYIRVTEGYSLQQSPELPQSPLEEVLKAKEQEILELQRQREEDPRYHQSLARLKQIASRRRSRKPKDIYERQDQCIRSSPYKATEDFQKIASNQNSPFRVASARNSKRVSSAPYSGRKNLPGDINISTSPSRYYEEDLDIRSPIHNDLDKLVSMCENVMRDVNSARNLHKNSFRNLSRKYSKCQERIKKFEETREFERIKLELRFDLQTKEEIKPKVGFSLKRRETIRGIHKDISTSPKPMEKVTL